ncbi:MAG: DNA methyltransferase [Novosphingobium sp.]|nr:DNA methyltransferase [Novosphingobium sp.]
MVSNNIEKGVRSLGERTIQCLVPHDRNARTHSKAQIDLIARSITKYGFVSPVLIDAKNRIIAGHGRVEAARKLGMTSVPVALVEGLSEAELKAYVIADNRTAELAGWDKSLLSLELAAIAGLESDFDLSLTGFDGAELEALLNALDGEAGGSDAVPEVGKVAVSGPGDIWQMGPHRLICGDARDLAVYQALLGDERAQMVFTDPPYNVPITGHVCGLGEVKHREFAMAAGEMSKAEFTAFLASVLAQLAAYSADGSIHYVCMDWRHIEEIVQAGNAVYTELKNLIVWNKTNGGMGTFYRSKHELVFAFKHGTAAHINNFGLGQHGRYRANVWDYEGISSIGKNRADELAMHPTVKPVAMVADAIRDCSKRGGVILDAFSGSGTTIMAAEQTGRRGYAIELDPLYVDVAVRRWQLATGKKAMLAGSECSFDDIETMFE